jgi:chaperone required for assembly of F1-ATPase
MSTTVIDVWSNPTERQKKIETMMSFLQSDSISYRSSQPPALVRLQEKHWDPIMAFMAKEFKCKLPISTMWTVRLFVWHFHFLFVLLNSSCFAGSRCQV